MQNLWRVDHGFYHYTTGKLTLQKAHKLGLDPSFYRLELSKKLHV